MFVIVKWLLVVDYYAGRTRGWRDQSDGVSCQC